MAVSTPPPDELELSVDEETMSELDALIKEARRRARRRRLACMATAGLVVGLAVGPIFFFGGGGGGTASHSGHGRSQPSAHALRTRQAGRAVSVPLSRRYVSGLSFVDAQHGWALLAPSLPGFCGMANHKCSSILEVIGTRDGGRTWSQLGSMPCTGSDNCSPFDIQRLDRSIGFVGGWDSFVTTDGGRRWIPTRQPIEAATRMDGGVGALTYRGGGCPFLCNVGLGRARLGTANFTPVRSFTSPSRGFGDALLGNGHDLYAFGFGHPAGGAGYAYVRLAISHDAGRTWATRGDPCHVPGSREIDATQAAAAGRYLALICSPRAGGDDSIAFSTDSGRTFTRLQPNIRFFNEISIDARGNLAVANGAISGSGRYRYELAISLDHASSWRTVLDRVAAVPSGFPGFTTSPARLARFGRSIRWLTGNRRLWSSDNAGRSWQTTNLPY